MKLQIYLIYLQALYQHHLLNIKARVMILIRIFHICDVDFYFWMVAVGFEFVYNL